MGKKINSSSANAQSNGWTFQFVSALVIFLENMEETKDFGVEGEEDIVVTLKDDNKIFAQAKSSLEKDRIVAKQFKNIMDSIRTLSRNNENNSRELICVSNFYNPLGEKDGFLCNQFLDKKILKI